MSTSSTWLSTARTPAFCHFRIVFHVSPQRFRKLSTETALQSLCPHPAFCLGKPAHPVQNPARMCGGTFFLKGNDLLCSTGERFLFFYRERFLFLKKRNKRHCGAVDLSVNRCFPARPARNEKNGRFGCEPSVLCSTLVKKATAAESNCSAIDFLLLPFLSRKKRKTPISAAVQWRGSRPRSPPYPRSRPHPQCNGPYDPSE